MDNNARCIIQLRLNHTMATNNSKILVNYNNKGIFLTLQGGSVSLPQGKLTSGPRPLLIIMKGENMAHLVLALAQFLPRS